MQCLINVKFQTVLFNECAVAPDDLVPDKNLAAKLKNEISKEVMRQDHTEAIKMIEAQSNIIIAEAKGDSWLQKSWRPILMLCIVAIIANNYILFPYLSMFTDKAAILDLPDKLYSLLNIGVGGYVVSRGGEKIVKTIKGKD